MNDVIALRVACPRCTTDLTRERGTGHGALTVEDAARYPLAHHHLSADQVHRVAALLSAAVTIERREQARVDSIRREMSEAAQKVRGER
ncbi:hypothetical protein ABE437_18785 [Isoptericola cucumis]|uniref:hypothetical protein n=1 Tax=Isoptericola cucumis TaxID=1776856 RepID=UPI00320A36A4